MPGITPQEVIAGMPKPQIHRLKDLGLGLTMGKVFGTRVLVEPIQPYTDLDRMEKEGLIVAPKSVKDANTPKPSTGVVLQLGEELLSDWSRRYAFADYPLKEGDYVMFSKFAGSTPSVGGVEYIMLDIAEIMCTVVAVNPEAYAVTTD